MCPAQDELQEKGRESFKDSKQTTRLEVRGLSNGFGERFWIFRFERIIYCDYLLYRKLSNQSQSSFLDASSEHMSAMDTTDSEDSPRPQQGRQASSSGQPSQLTMVGGSYSNLSRMIIMNNVLLKQVHTHHHLYSVM